jgi:hypothetical protein
MMAENRMEHIPMKWHVFISPWQTVGSVTDGRHAYRIYRDSSGRLHGIPGIVLPLGAKRALSAVTNGRRMAV